MSVKTPFSDAIGPDKVPTKGTSGEYGRTEVPGTPGRSGSGVAPELSRDTAVTSSSPKTSGPVKTTFKDAV